MLRVAFDRQIFSRQRVGGISRYFVALIAELRRDPELGIEPVLEFRTTGNAYAATLDGVRSVPHPMLARLFDRGASREVDVRHFTYYGTKDLVRMREAPSVTTLHDMIPETLPHEFTSGNPHEAKERYLADSTIVVSVSRASLEAARELGYPVSHAVVTPLGVDASEFPFSEGPRSSDVLFVGARSGYKNFAFAAETFAATGGDGRLVCLGGGALTRSEVRLLTRLGIAERVLQLEPSDRELSNWYRSSCALLAVSRIEGFGLPVLEAAASGCPVISLGIPAIREVIGDAGLHVEDLDVATAAEMLRACAAQTTEIRALRIEALARAREMTWRRTAERTAAAYYRAATANKSGDRWLLPTDSMRDE